jgi:hypothetical protein
LSGKSKLFLIIGLSLKTQLGKNPLTSKTEERLGEGHHRRGKFR